MIKRGNKKAQELSTSTIVLIILALVILVILIYGFTKGWGNFADFFKKSNVDNIINACQIACATGSTHDFCSVERELRAEGLPNGEKKVNGTCNFFSHEADYIKYGISPCSSINCASVKIPCASIQKIIKGKTYTGKLMMSGNNNCDVNLTSLASDLDDINTQCCGEERTSG